MGHNHRWVTFEGNFVLFFFRNLQQNLTQEWNDKLALEIVSESKLLNTQEKCSNLSQELDERNFKLHRQLLRYSNNLYNFEFVSTF